MKYRVPCTGCSLKNCNQRQAFLRLSIFAQSRGSRLGVEYLFPTLTTEIVVNLRPRVLEKLGSPKPYLAILCVDCWAYYRKCAFTFHFNSSDGLMVDVI